MEYYGCYQTLELKFTTNLIQDYIPRRVQELKRYIIDRYVSNIQENIDTLISSEINGVIQQFYGMDNRDSTKVRNQWIRCCYDN